MKFWFKSFNLIRDKISNIIIIIIRSYEKVRIEANFFILNEILPPQN